MAHSILRARIIMASIMHAGRDRDASALASVRLHRAGWYMRTCFSFGTRARLEKKTHPAPATALRCKDREAELFAG